MNEKRIEKLEKRLAELMEMPQIGAGLDFIQNNEEYILKIQKELTLVEAPTFEEEERGKVMAGLFEQVGLEEIRVDEIGNVSGLLRGRDPKKGETLAVEAHMDTVFPKGSVTRVEERDGILYAPGISDNTRGLALLLGVIMAFRKAGLEPKRDILFAATVREEGLGGLRGLKYFLDHHDEVTQCITVDGPDADVIVLGGPGIRTLEINFEGRSGHTWKHYGKIANPVHAAVLAMSRMVRLPLPVDPKTTFAVTAFEGGEVGRVNVIPARARLVLNYRSVSMEELAKLDQTIRKAAQEGADEENALAPEAAIKVTFRDITDIPAAGQGADSVMVSSMAFVIRTLGMEPILDGGCPTNANMSLGKGIEGICIGGGGRAGLNHSQEEWFDTRESYKGVQAAFLELALLAGV